MTKRIANVVLNAVVGASVFAFAACSNQPVLGTADNYAPSVTARRVTVGQDNIPAQQDQGAIAARMAVTHSFTLRIPSADIEATQRKHLDECAKLHCIVISTRLNRSDAGRVFAGSSIRINPDGFAEFAKALASPPAEVVSHAQSAEDKTIPLLDVEKRIELKTALRDRLEAMLKDPGTKSAADLLAIEKELTQIQGDIESATAQRAYLRRLTDTVRVDISYQGTVALTAGIDFEPIREAATASGQTITWSVATLITFLAAALPWLPLVALLAWGARRVFRRRRAPAA